MCASGSLHQQLHSWARHAAAVRAGGLHVAAELHNCPVHMAVSPKMNLVAGHCDAQAARVMKLAPLPTAGTRDVQQLLQTEGQTLQQPGLPKGLPQWMAPRCESHLWHSGHCAQVLPPSMLCPYVPVHVGPEH